MAICNALTTAVSKSCDTNIGGIKQMFIADWQELNLTLDANGMVTSFNSTPNFLIASGTATWTLDTGAGVWLLKFNTVPGDYTSQLVAGVLVTSTYRDQFGNINTITYPIIGATYNAGTNTTTISPDWITYGYQPIVGTNPPAAPSETGLDVFIGNPFFEFEFNKNTSNLEETMSTEVANSSTIYTQTVNLVLNRRDKLKREVIVSLYSGVKKLNIVVIDNNSNAWLVGNEFGAFLTSLAGGTGTALQDKNSFDLSFVSESSEPARAVSSAVLANGYFIQA